MALAPRTRAAAGDGNARTTEDANDELALRIHFSFSLADVDFNAPLAQGRCLGHRRGRAPIFYEADYVLRTGRIYYHAARGRRTSLWRWALDSDFYRRSLAFARLHLKLKVGFCY